MISLKFFRNPVTAARLATALLLLATLALAETRDQNPPPAGSEQERQPPAPPTGEASGEKPAQQPGEERLPDLEQIDAFRIKLGDPRIAGGGPNDKSLALIVNPFNVRKRGRLYGSLYEYHRNDNFDARNFFDPVGEPLPEFKRNQFGVSMGAFLSGKLAVFGSYDGLRINKGSTMLSLVPTEAMKRGDFSQFDGPIYDPWTGQPFIDNRIPAERIHPVSSKMLSLYPDPNRDDPTRNFVNNQPNVNYNNTITARVDYELSRKTKIFGNYNFVDSSEVKVASLPAFGTTEDQRRQSMALNVTHAFTPSRVLNLKLDFRRETELELSGQAFQEGLLASLGIEGVSTLDAMDEGYPEFEISSYATLGLGYRNGSPNTAFRNTYRAEVDFTYVRGNHRIGLGGDLEFRQTNDTRTWGTRRGRFGFSGNFTGDAFADFLLGIPDEATRGIGSDRADLRQRSWRVYLRDDWKINRRFTLSLGLGYSFSPFARSIHDNVSFFFPLLFEPPRDGEIILTGSSRARELGLTLNRGQAAYDDRNDWQPHVGLAYSPLGNNRLVFRASYRIQHRSMDFRQSLNYIGRNYPFFYMEKTESPTSPDLDLSTPFASAVPTELTIRALDPYLRNPYIQEWDLSAQYEFWRSWNLELAYEGRKATRLNRTIPSNVPVPAPAGELIQPRRPNPDFGRFDIMSGSGSLSGHALDAQLRRRMTGAFSLQAGFKWNRSFSDTWGGGDPSNPRDLSSERAFSGYEPPKRANLNFIFDLPVGRDKFIATGWAGKLGFLLEGWRVSGIAVFEEGRPFSPRISGDPNNDGVSGDRPDRIASGLLPASERSVDQWFDASAFAQPAYAGSPAGWFGNSGRNILATPGEHRWDIAFLKRTRMWDSGHLLEFRIELFNAFNHVNFERPGTTLDTSTFGVISNAGDAREIEIAIKYFF